VPQQTPWSAPPDQPELGPRDIHVWHASLEQPPEIVRSLRSLLSADEIAKADRFRFDKDQRHFTVARGTLRKLLGRYLNISPQEIRFDYSDYGKPSLRDPDGSSLKFNLAHSGGIALYAFTMIGEVGVDVEFIRPEFTGDDIARRFFSPAEVSSLGALPDEVRSRAFFNCWSRKEAFIKAKGLGLSLGLDQFDVTLEHDVPVAVLATRWDESEAARWSLKAIDVGADYAGALAIESSDWQASYYRVTSLAAV
jgi:4'-phosphopantetheinyl transferase